VTDEQFRYAYINTVARAVASDVLDNALLAGGCIQWSEYPEIEDLADFEDVVTAIRSIVLTLTVTPEAYREALASLEEGWTS
jgi:hypothetical protein